MKTETLNKKRCYYHGYYYHPLYRVWKGMKRRCLGANADNFKYYGGRGISICEDWINSAKSFIEWALSHGWAEGLELDRIDNNGNYEPQNCRFIASAKNKSNRRRPIRVAKESKLPIGVTKHRSKYKASIRVKGKSIYLGSFKTILEAEQSYQAYLNVLTKEKE